MAVVDSVSLEVDIQDAEKLLKRALPEDLESVIRNSALRAEELEDAIEANEARIATLADQNKECRRLLGEFQRQRADAEKARRRTASYRRRRRAALRSALLDEDDAPRRRTARKRGTDSDLETARMLASLDDDDALELRRRRRTGR